MKVTLLDFTGKGTSDPARYAARVLIYAKSTRLTQGQGLQDAIHAMAPERLEQELKAIQMSVRSSWEFVHYTWQIEGVTRAFTHQFVRSRHASFAQQAMRVADMSEFQTLCPVTVIEAGKTSVWLLCMQMIASTYSELRAAGVPAQDARGVLPTNVLTNIVASYNLRSLAELIGKRLNQRAQDEYVDVLRAMVDCVLEVHPWAKIFLFPERTSTPALDKILADQLDGKSPVDAPEVNDALKELDMVKGAWG
jgi:thymidylate synthase (FAD)